MKRSHRFPVLPLACLGLALVGPATAEEPSASRASLIRLMVDDSPREPVGDEITALVLLEPGVDEVRMEIRAVDDSPRPDEAAPDRPAIRYLEGTGEAERDPEGRFLLVAVASRPGGDGVVRVVIPPPRSGPRFRPGQLSYRYAAIGRIGGEEVFFATSRSLLVPALRPPRRADGPPPTPSPQAPSKALPSPQAPSKALPAPQAPSAAFSASPFAAPRERTIRFATNRVERASTGTPSERFGDEIDDVVRYGSCVVNVPTERRDPGELPIPEPGGEGNPAREFFILENAVRSLAEAEFRDVMRGDEAGRDVLVYVHGFNTSFDFAVVRLAQVAEDVGFAGSPVVFSWPARETSFPWPSDYDRDEANADRSYGALARVLKTIAEEQASRPAERRGRIHVIAHSLGNRVTMRALAILDTLLPAGSRPLGQVVLAAPDVSIEEFGRLLPSVGKRSERVSLYFNPHDQALWASFARHGRERRAGNSARFLPGLDNIDAAGADTSLLGHGYWSDARIVLADLHLLIAKGWGPDRRTPAILRAFDRPHPYWAVQTESWFASMRTGR